jgi:indoleamine 2,3-dioxygenase
MPSNDLTAILKDFRTYRPATHNAFLTWTEQQADKLDVVAYAKQNGESGALMLLAFDQVREFRDRHWKFTYTLFLTNRKEYILRHSNHPVATGGSPIVTWLPNQLNAILDAMITAKDELSSATGTVRVFDARLEGEDVDGKDEEMDVGEVVRMCGERAEVEKAVLAEEVRRFSGEKGKEAVDAESKF